MTEQEEMKIAAQLMMRAWEIKEGMEWDSLESIQVDQKDLVVMFKALVNYTSHLYFKDPVVVKVGTEEYKTQRVTFDGSLHQTPTPEG